MKLSNVILVLADCLSISHLKKLPQDGRITVCLVKDNLPNTQAIMQSHFKEYEVLYQEDCPSNVVYLALPPTTGHADNYLCVYNWFVHQVEQAKIDTNNPGPYQYL